MSASSEDRVLIVGGGVAGLICAGTLASRGRNVVLLDAGAQLGGRAASTEHEGYVMNEGAHALYPSSERMLVRAGVKPTGGHPRVNAGRLLYSGELLPAPFGPRALLGAGPLSARERAQLMRALASAAAGSPARLRGQSASAWVDAHSSTTLLSGLLGALLRLSTYCGDLDALPAAVGVGALGEATRRPVRYIDGGWRSITRALADRAEEHGAQLHRGARVQELLADGAIAGARLHDGSEHAARTVILAGLPPARAARLLQAAGGRLPASVAEPRTIRAACLDVALSELPRADCPFVLGVDEPLYLSVHSLASKLTPGRGAVVQLLRYDDGGETSSEEALAQLESLLDRAQPGWRAHVVHRRFAPRMVVVGDLPSPALGLAGRPSVRDTALPGAFIAGDWVGSDGWLASASLRSGIDAAEAVIAAGTGAGSGDDAHASAPSLAA